jgi:hypothetical protein
MKKIEVNESALDSLKAMVQKLQDERDALYKDAIRYRSIREGIKVDQGNSGIVVSLVDDFGGVTLCGDRADMEIDAAISACTAPEKVLV